jgi:hypothetical protein
MPNNGQRPATNTGTGTIEIKEKATQISNGLKIG